MNRPLILTDPTGLQTGETAPPQKAPKTDSDRLTPPAIDVGKDLPKGRNEWQIRVVDKQAIALNGEDIRDSEGKIVEENGKVFTNQNAILARITYAVIPPANVSEYGEVTAITMKEKITDETLNGKRQEDYERSIPLTKDGESGVWLGSDLVGTSSDAPNKPTSILKGTQTLELIVTINGTKNDPFPARKNTYEVNPKTNTIRITEVPINGDNNEDDLLENKR